MIQNAIVAGFQENCNSGPLMNEPLYGVCYCIDTFDISLSSLLRCCSPLSIEDIMTVFHCTHPLTNIPSLSPCSSSSSETTMTTATSSSSSFSLSSGQLISEVKTTLKLSMLCCPLRIVEPIYACDLQCDQSQLGNLYGNNNNNNNLYSILTIICISTF